MIKYVDVNGRTKLAIRDRISDYIPNPTFGKVAAPGGAGMDITQGRRRFRRSEAASLHRQKMVVMPGIDAFFDPEPRLELMKEMGIDRTVAVADPRQRHRGARRRRPRHRSDGHPCPERVDARALGLRLLRRDLLDADHQPRGRCRSCARGVGVRPRARGQDLPHPGRARSDVEGPQVVRPARSSIPFWERVQELDIVVGMHSGDPGYHRYLNEWEGLGDQEMSIAKGARQANPAFVILSSEKDNLIDAMASIIGHGLATRFPRLRFMPVEFASGWIRTFYTKLQRAYDDFAGAVRREPGRGLQPERVGARLPRAAIRRASSTWASPSTTSCSAPTSRTRRGWPTRWPTAEVVEDLPLDQQALIMGGSLERAMRVGRYA